MYLHFGTENDRPRKPAMCRCIGTLSFPMTMCLCLKLSLILLKIIMTLFRCRWPERVGVLGQQALLRLLRSFHRWPELYPLRRVPCIWPARRAATADSILARLRTRANRARRAHWHVSYIFLSHTLLVRYFTAELFTWNYNYSVHINSVYSNSALTAHTVTVTHSGLVLVVKYSMIHTFMTSCARSRLPSSNFIDCFQSQNM